MNNLQFTIRQLADKYSRLSGIHDAVISHINSRTASGQKIRKLISKLTTHNSQLTTHFPPPTIHHSQPNRGFTLIELLVVIALIGIIGTVTTQVFILGFRSQGKSEVVKEVKQNGDYVFSVMESTIKNAADIKSLCNVSSNQLTLLNTDGYTTTFDCSSDSYIASISGGIVADLIPTPTGVPLNSNKVTISSCTFRVVCPTPPLSPKYVFVNYTVSQAGSSLTPTPGSSSVIEYESTFSLGRYQ